MTFEPSWMVHAGEILKEEVDERGWSHTEAMERLHWGPNLYIGVLLGDIAIDERLAEALSRALGTSAQYWLNLQAQYTRARQEATDDEDLPGR